LTPRYADCFRSLNSTVDSTNAEYDGCEGWSFSQAFYFAVTSISTAGLLGIPVDSPTWHYVFVGFYLLIGVPVFGNGISKWVEILLNKKHKKTLQEKEIKRKGYVRLGFSIEARV
jgi:hypothetical protein